MKSCTIQHLHPMVKKIETKIGPKILANPYYGCEHSCLFCPANDGFLNRKVFDDFREKRIIYVVDNIVDHVCNYLDDNDQADSVHLSPVSDPFQPIEYIEHKSEDIIDYANRRGYPVAICTKGKIPDHIIPKIKENSHSFVQVSILTLNEEKRKKIVRGSGGTVEELLGMIEKLTETGILVIGRIDPIFPYITDNMDEFAALILELKKRKITHIVSSIADIIPGALERESDYLDSIERNLSKRYKQLYTHLINGRLHADLEYRENLFSKMKSICEDYGMKFGITWEPDNEGNSINSKFSHELNDVEKADENTRESRKYQKNSMHFTYERV